MGCTVHEVGSSVAALVVLEGSRELLVLRLQPLLWDHNVADVICGIDTASNAYQACDMCVRCVVDAVDNMWWR